MGGAAGGDVERLLKRIAKTAQGFIAGVERRAVDGFALFDAAQCHAQAPGAQPGVKGHAEMLLEPAPQFQRLDALGEQLGIGPAMSGSASTDLSSLCTQSGAMAAASSGLQRRQAR